MSAVDEEEVSEVDEDEEMLKGVFLSSPLTLLQSTKFHPSKFRSQPVVCDECGNELGVEEGWYHLCNDTYDVCHACYEEVEEERRRKFKLTLEDLGEEESVYREEMEKRERQKAATKNFKIVSLAYRVLKDAELRRIYVESGWHALVKSETYSECSVFTTDPFRQYDSFFNGEDEDDRQYLLLNGTEPISDDDEDVRGGAGGQEKAGEEEDEASASEEDEDEEVESEMPTLIPSDEISRNKLLEREPPPPPRPPVTVQAPSSFLAGRQDADPWKLITCKVEQKEAEEADKLPTKRREKPEAEGEVKRDRKE
ncbi:hypothetical protein GUITHDRAFT_105138 [Guillardia theta CCMP2712]|uniref:ZZ-type domain-containing protein n=1 Tax=Guillardia theta (strain CCMP2712) TaxID=905079 RepID=L1JKM5_GUITC|nr:hypothetical protein GUITHDRAFT_105138 [Guillardia theta CCMP2712]EKX49056.1 hypothetical protein GUITHDRAFT_105138 [Guillardia theta CCMP2712]|eukprot:XP_005836036.1 hypothetical protein GUITHDRAFT_105138 [Guillardia theta CCMP2712]